MFGCFSLRSDFIKFHYEIDKLKSILYINSYPRDLVDKCIKEFLNKILAPKPVVSTVLKKNLVIALPYLGKLSLEIRTRINRITKNKLPHCNIRFVFKTKCKISNFFTFKATLMQIKSPCIFFFIQKHYPENFAFLILRFFELYTHKVCIMFVYKHTETVEYVKKKTNC